MLLAPPGRAVVVSTPVHEAPAPVFKLAPAGVQVTGPESKFAPFLNCTVPVGPCALLLVEEPVAVSVTLPPATIELELATTELAVAAGVMVNMSVLLPVLCMKLLSPVM